MWRMSWERRATGYNGDDHERDVDGKLYQLPRSARSRYRLCDLSRMAYGMRVHNTLARD